MDNLKTINSFYNIPPEVISDISFFAAEVERFKKGEISPERFKPTRVTRGIYGQRGQTTFMARIKAPGGGLVSGQIKRIAELSERYGNAVPHVTARQGMQVHGVRIDDIIACIEGLAEVGLSTRGGGGNTVRNITACPDAGVCENEAFDVAPYAAALTEFFLSHPKAFTLPRKYKIAFSGCPRDGALATVNDLGFIAKKKLINGKEVKGFTVYAAGGMGAYSRVASLLEEFVPDGDAVYVAEAIMNVFDRHGNRRNKHKARLRFVIDRYGYDEFKRLYKEELERVMAEGPRTMDLRPAPMPRSVRASGSKATFHE
ncbi:MAG: nitrite/sulfite reductase, partial [Deltaproteobacteria bacterium]|nr:nitrite/sulfite reductase [Deltaproteobacteria bacterium]